MSDKVYVLAVCNRHFDDMEIVGVYERLATATGERLRRQKLPAALGEDGERWLIYTVARWEVQ